MNAKVRLSDQVKLLLWVNKASTEVMRGARGEGLQVSYFSWKRHGFWTVCLLASLPSMLWLALPGAKNRPTDAGSSRSPVYGLSFGLEALANTHSFLSAHTWARAEHTGSREARVCVPKYHFWALCLECHCRCKKKITAVSDRHRVELMWGAGTEQTWWLWQRQEERGAWGQTALRPQEREQIPGEADPKGEEHCRPPWYEGLSMPRTFPQAWFGI